MNNKENREWYYTYKTTCNVNGKVYVGVHKTDNINDGYMGSGLLLRRAIHKYGKENFTVEILQHFDSYREALEHEAEIVNEEFVKDDNTYNLKHGGFGGTPSQELKDNISRKVKQQWKENREYMMSTVHSKQSCKRKSDAIKKYISNNREEFTARVNRINKDPVKIKKTADKHRGMKRSDESKQLMSESRKEMLINNKHLVGSGMKYVTDMSTMTLKRVPCDYVLLENEVFGNKVKKTSKEAAGLGMKFVTDMTTGKQFKVNSDYIPQGNEVFGRKKLE